MTEITVTTELIGVDSALVATAKGDVIHVPYSLLSPIDALKVKKSKAEIRIMVYDWMVADG
jgi:hypothetical protein